MLDFNQLISSKVYITWRKCRSIGIISY